MFGRIWLGTGAFALCAAAFALFLHHGSSAPVPLEAQLQALIDLQRSHIDGNVPSPESFRPFLLRDLEAYFQDAGAHPLRADYQLLREVPTQSGVALPKFYAWVTVTCAGAVCREGAVTVAAAEKSRFDVLNFIAKADMRRGSESLARDFPAALVPAILVKAGISP